MREVIRARGHEHVRAEHASTFEVTSDDWLTPAGDCIIGVEADRTPADFDPAFVEACQSHDATIDVRVRVDADGDTYEQTVRARGHPDLSFEGDRSVVFRTSDYVDDRTGAVGAAHAAAGFDRDLVSALADGAELTVTIEVE
ncbi:MULTISPECIES: DUF371 domain-containing protein [Haloferax]|uniref:DUF371 family protein n=2 Tax=Haloferax gibbonsii TaxID=35746 RepID=A0A0K1IRA0_HALGI|nr:MULTISPECIES: DUF371 domain-containing protein [Haloferax]AKU06986.1 hypothetical protein ABY42_04220 [Haloferax gibbonsii]ELZ83282.1 hypothetical protein C454_03192 [Haloferax gibbonsii ATCC 33959]QOS11035.1 DUF371 family protein [Haloferax gibbonsii]RDZ54840.1 DUF371 domain-containing protein [Haloferax sp. Atlit-4N]REA05522.1 DUF371 domain-containing protein [Haloferax sp. Atlit-6N]